MISFLTKNLVNPSCVACRRISIRTCVYNQELENNYSDVQKEKILQIINNEDTATLSRYNITKLKLKKIIDWRNKNGNVKSLSDLETIDGFTERYSKKLCNNILDGPQTTENNLTKKIKGQVLHPNMPEAVRRVKKNNYTKILVC